MAVLTHHPQQTSSLSTFSSLFDIIRLLPYNQIIIMVGKTLVVVLSALAVLSIAAPAPAVMSTFAPSIVSLIFKIGNAHA